MSFLLQLKFLGLCILVLAEIAASVAYVNYIVRFKSGLENNQTLRRMWSKPELVIFQPIWLLMLFTWIVGFGINILTRSIMVGFLQLIDALRIAGELSMAGDFAVTVAGTAAGTLLSSIIYLVYGGSKLPIQGLGTLAMSLVVSLPRVVTRAPPLVITLWILAVIGIVVGVNFWIYTRKLLSRVPASASREHFYDSFQSLGLPAARGRAAIMAVACAFHLWALRSADLLIIVYVEKNNYGDIYLAQVLRNFAGLMVLIGCSFTGILMTNATIVVRTFMWKWPSVLLPMAFVPMVDLVRMFFSSAESKGWPSFVHNLERPFMYGAAGFLGSAVYLGVLARAASQALDPGIEGQSELIVDDEDSEYDIEA